MTPRLNIRRYSKLAILTLLFFGTVCHSTSKADISNFGLSINTGKVALGIGINNSYGGHYARPLPPPPGPRHMPPRYMPPPPYRGPHSMPPRHMPPPPHYGPRPMSPRFMPPPPHHGPGGMPPRHKAAPPPRRSAPPRFYW